MLVKCLTWDVLHVFATCARMHVRDVCAPDTGANCTCIMHMCSIQHRPVLLQSPHFLLSPLSSRWCHPQLRLTNGTFTPSRLLFAKTTGRTAAMGIINNNKGTSGRGPTPDRQTGMRSSM